MSTEKLVLDFLVRAEEVKQRPETQKLLRPHLRSLIRERRKLSFTEFHKLRYGLRYMEKGHWDAQTLSLAATLLFLLDCEYKRMNGVLTEVDLGLDTDTDLGLDEEEEEENNNNNNSSQRKKKKKKKGRFRAALKKLKNKLTKKKKKKLTN